MSYLMKMGYNNMEKADLEDESLDLELDVSISSPEKGKTGEDIDFSVAVSGGQEPYYYDWDFDGDGITDSEEKNPTYSFDEPGTYNITVKVYDDITFSSGLDSVTFTVEVGTGGDSSSSLTMFIALIAIIVIAGVAVLVYFIRK